MGSFCTRMQVNSCFCNRPRKQYVANELLKLTAKRLSELRPLFVSDGLKFYTKALLNEFGEIKEFPRTGKRGRPRNLKTIPPEDLEYAQVIKKKREEGYAK
jgi:hypothetical protein